MGGRGGTSKATTAPAAGPVASRVGMVVDAIRSGPNTTGYPIGDGARMLSDIRDALARQGVTGRAEQDQAILAADRAGRIQLAPAIGKAHLTQREHDGAVLLAGEPQDWARLL